MIRNVTDQAFWFHFYTFLFHSLYISTPYLVSTFAFLTSSVTDQTFRFHFYAFLFHSVYTSTPYLISSHISAFYYYKIVLMQDVLRFNGFNICNNLKYLTKQKQRHAPPSQTHTRTEVLTQIVS